MALRGIMTVVIFGILATTVLSRDLLQVDGDSKGKASASSCSFAGVQSTGGKGTAHAQAHSAAITTASKGCATAVSSLLKASCSGVNALVAISNAASACSAAFAKVYVKTVGVVQTSGRSQACAQACANSYAYAEAVSKAVVESYGKEGTKCEAVEVYLKSEVFTKAIAAAFGDSFSKACADARGGKASAKTVAEGWLTVTSTAIAKALGSAVALSCSKCGDSCKCRADVKYEAESKTDVYSEVVGGTYALTKAIADAGAISCKGKGSAEATKTAVETYLKAYADICIKVAGKLYASASSNGQCSFACSGVFGSYAAASEALSEVVTKAWANNYDGFCTDVFSYIQGSALVKDAAKVVGSAYTAACSANGSPTSTTSTSIYEYITQYQPFSEALQEAYSSASTSCPCPDPYLCCSTCDLTQTCPAYKN